MADIYSSAAIVIAWLQDETSGFDAALAFECVRDGIVHGSASLLNRGRDLAIQKLFRCRYWTRNG
jgi:hypothetical protein